MSELTIKNFHCSKHGDVKPVPKCPECLSCHPTTHSGIRDLIKEFGDMLTRRDLGGSGIEPEVWLHEKLTHLSTSLQERIEGERWQHKIGRDEADMAIEVGSGAIRYVGEGAQIAASTHNAAKDRDIHIIKEEFGV
jgi:hypothetical protein